MKIFFTIASLLFTLSASAATFDCLVKYNYETVLIANFSLNTMESKKFGAFEDYEFTLKHTGKILSLSSTMHLNPPAPMPWVILRSPRT